MKLLLILPILLTGCISTYTPAEQRCIKAGLGINTMKVVEDYSKAQEVVVSCTKKPSKLEDSNENTNLHNNNNTSNTSINPK